MALDPTWLADPARVFPVTIDPTFALYSSQGAGGGDTFVINAGYENTNFALVGAERRVASHPGGLLTPMTKSVSKKF